MFDVITYEKASCVIRMFRDYLGAEVFDSAINSYLLEFQWGNSTSKDLWRHIT